MMDTSGAPGTAMATHSNMARFCYARLSLKPNNDTISTNNNKMISNCTNNGKNVNYIRGVFQCLASKDTTQSKSFSIPSWIPLSPWRDGRCLLRSRYVHLSSKCLSRTVSYLRYESWSLRITGRYEWEQPAKRVFQSIFPHEACDSMIIVHDEC